MITAITASNQQQYRDLYDNAADILTGYKKVRTFNANVSTYFYKDGDNVFQRLDDIDSLVKFANALSEYEILYAEILDEDGNPIGVTDGFEPEVGITTLEEYFSWIRTLGQIRTSDDPYYGKKFTMLPLDEPHFEIDTNTRAIKIPDAFKKNGIAVQSDDLAEVVYFKVDRYYDYMDLNNCEIYIQWETPKSKTADSVKSVSPAYIRDITSEPGKLIFGWAISDAITGASGNLKFSVRFFQWADKDAVTSGGEKVLAYSLSTLTATVAIQPAIDFNPESDEYTVDEVSDRLLERLQNSEIAGGIAAEKPEFVKDLDDPNANLIYDLDTEAGTYALLVQAFAADTGAISYTWKYQELSPENSVKDMPIKVLADSKVSIVYSEVEPVNMSKEFCYYWGDNHIKYEGNIPPLEDEITKYGKFYVKQSQCLADAAGDYWVVAENRITNSVTAANSKMARLPRPEAVIISKQPVDGLLAEDATGEKVYKINVTADNTDGVLSYQWQKSDDYSVTSDPAALEYVDIEGADMAEYEVDSQGRYRVVVTNTRNKETSVLNSDICRVTDEATAPVIKSTLHQIFVDEEVGALNCPTITLDESIDSDKYIVEWYVYEAPGEGKIKTDELEPGSYISKLNPKSPEVLAEIQKITGDTDIIAKYYAIVTNELNGSFAATDKPVEGDMMEIRAKEDPTLPEDEDETEN